MSIFEETEPRLFAAMLVPLLAFMLIFPLWHIGERDLYWEEGEYAAATHEMNSFPPVATAHGELVSDVVYPLFPFLAAKLHRATGWSMEFCLRFLSVVSLGGLAALAWESCRRTMGLQAAAVAAAMMISTALVAEKAIDGFPHMMALLLVTAGWLSWFTLGQSRGNWDYAWIAAGFFAGLAFYCNGWEALCYFILPLLFMQRPLSIWGKLNRPGFYAGAALLLAFILLWAIPRWRFNLDSPLRSSLQLDSGLSLTGYFAQLALFPFEVALRFMPWTIIIWAPFCAAMLPLDRNPLFSRFLRTIFITLFIFIWLLPAKHGRDFLALAPALSMLVALYYWIAVRRHGDALLAMLRWTAWGLVAGGLLCLAFYLTPLSALQDVVSIGRDLSYKSDAKIMLRGIIESLASLMAAALTLWLCRTRAKVWIAILSLFVSAMFIFWAAGNPYKASDRSRSNMGAELREALAPYRSPDLVVYKDIKGLFAECEYMGCKVVKLNSAADLLFKDSKEVFVIASEVPSVPERVWTNLLQESKSKYKDKRLCLWKGVLKDDRRSDVNR